MQVSTSYNLKASTFVTIALRAVAAGIPLTCGALVIHMHVPISFEQTVQMLLYGERLSIPNMYRYSNVMQSQDRTSFLSVRSGQPYSGTRKRGDIIQD